MLKEEKFTQDDWLGLPWFPEDNAPNDLRIQEQWLLVAGVVGAWEKNPKP